MSLIFSLHFSLLQVGHLRKFLEFKVFTGVIDNFIGKCKIYRVTIGTIMLTMHVALYLIAAYAF